MFNYIRRHWRGELSLGISYWLNSFLGNLIAFAAIFAINSVIEDSLKPVLILAGLTVNYALLSAITIWIITGTWRSAINHKEKTGRKVWATVAQFMLILGVIQFATAMVDGTKKITEVAKIVAGTDEISEFELKLIGGTVLQINGYITFQMIDDVDNYLKYNTNIKVIQLNSGGGRIGPARHIRNLILAKNLNTYTDTGCLSACTVAFISFSSHTKHGRSAPRARSEPNKKLRQAANRLSSNNLPCRVLLRPTGIFVCDAAWL